MATYTYTSTSPNGSIAPKNDQPTMLQNAQSIEGLISEDHIPFNTPNGGYHKVIHQPFQGSDPGTIAGVGQTYVKTIDGDQQLFYKSGNGTVTQLTSFGADTSVGKPNFGYASLQGGFLIQWGFIRIASDPNPYLFTTPNIPFPTRCVNVSLTLNATETTTSNNAAYVIGDPTPTGFQWGFTGTTSFQFIYWTAIGF